jgi:carbon monoxide dehydrogenase subunit G
MKFTNEIDLQLPPDEVFAALIDAERVAPCLPGARLEGRDGDSYLGGIRVKVGPVVANYAGKMAFEDVDQTNRRVVLRGSGVEAKGQGSAEARIVCTVAETVDGARVIVETDLDVAGRIAQFGSGPMEKIAKRLFAEFAKNLHALMTESVDVTPSVKTPTADLQGSAQGDQHARSHTAPSPTVNNSTSRSPDESLDVLGMLGESFPIQVRRDAVPWLLALLVVYVLGRSRGRRAN